MNYIVILGHTDPDICYKRCKVAVGHFNSLKDKDNTRIICSGGSYVRTDRPDKHGMYASKICEADLMASTLVDVLGVSMIYVLCENSSTNTLESFVKCRQMLLQYKALKYTEERELMKLAESIVICTSSFHVRRALVLAMYTFMGDALNINVIHTDEDVTNEQSNKEIVALDWQLGKFVQNITK